MRRDHWSEDAACDGADVNDFYPEGLGRMGYEPQEKRATALCSPCLVKDECLEDALRFGPTNQHGVAGEKTASERRAILKKRAAA